MRSMAAKDTKYGFGRPIDIARAEPVVVEKHGRPVLVVLAVEEFDQLQERALRSKSRAVLVRRQA